LAENGGPTQTHAFLFDSPAIDNGNLAACPGTDQRGVNRPQGDGCDIVTRDLINTLFKTTGSLSGSPIFVYLPNTLSPILSAWSLIRSSRRKVSVYMTSAFGLHDPVSRRWI